MSAAMTPEEIFAQRVPAVADGPMFVNRADRRAEQKRNKKRSKTALHNRRVNRRKK